MSMDGYGDLAVAMTVLAKSNATPRGGQEEDELADLNVRLSSQLNDYLHRSFYASGTHDDPVIWICDAPLGPVLTLDDFTTIVQVLAYGTDVTADCLPRKTNRAWAAYQQIVYAPAHIPTGWIGAQPYSQGVLIVKVIAGWPAVPDPIIQATTEALCRKWRARLNMYSDGGGSDALGQIGSPRPLLDADYKSQVAFYVRDLVTPIGGP